ncbi:c-type cytochrome [Poritiphilus flavus]|uniref:C-type cytochrome n=1 Tax=Poritiphilus flavus TaxID=2697053 RepID=A0A6L9EH98_9FLAO|nr:c-type cytochrome [Poritiphilus flavus]NAS14055.1 c-type cytochrome [Poritiphilus flavus]
MFTRNISPILAFLALFLLSCEQKTTKNKDSEEIEISFDLPENFELDELYHPSAYGQGSWVALAEGPDSRIYACDQRGKIYHFIKPGENEVLKPKAVDSVSLEIGEAHGLLWAFNSLYVAVNKTWDESIPEEEQNGSGIYRLTDTDADGELDSLTRLLKLEGAGEHGPHSFVLSPDGKYIYFIAGNHVLLPEALKEKSRLPTNWGEDNLFTPFLDARGHANEIKAPGGWIARFTEEGNDWELISAGYRNPFDLAFNQDGELFTYDADMEWDIGMPWYRPTRICHVTSGSEYGWRTGSGKWPDYYPDNLPSVHNLEQGSPTAVLSGAGLNFPSKYKNGLFVMDWSFGTVYFADLIAEGSTYTAEREEFLTGVPLPLTDMIAGSDGHLYFATGGRGLDSHLYRLRYVGPENSTEIAKSTEEQEELRKLRHRIEKYHSQADKNAIPLAWDNLDHQDRFVRYASRIALENLPTADWKQQFLAERDPLKVITAGVAMARQGWKESQSELLSRLNSLNFNELTESQKLDLLRAYSLSFIRSGQPSVADARAVIQKLKPHFPNENNAITREMAQILAFLNADGITGELCALLQKHTREKTVIDRKMLSEETTMRSEHYGPLIREVLAKMPPSEGIYYGVLLSNVSEGWTKDLREDYFQWFYDVLSAKGGMSFKACMENVRLRALSHVPESEVAYFEELTGVYSPETVVADLPQPIGPGSEYSGSDMSDMLWGDGMKGHKANFENGKRAYDAALCILCHRMRGEGGATGPDLSQIHTKFGRYDMLFAIYSPNDEISDQYAFTLFHMADDRKIAGRILSEDADSVQVAPNPLNPAYSVSLDKSEISKRELSPISPMPSGLLNRLNKEEIADLFTYLLAGADENHELYQDEAGSQ